MLRRSFPPSAQWPSFPPSAKRPSSFSPTMCCGWPLGGQVMAELGLPFDRQTLFGVSMHYKTFLYGYEQVRPFLFFERNDRSAKISVDMSTNCFIFPEGCCRSKQSLLLSRVRVHHIRFFSPPFSCFLCSFESPPFFFPPHLPLPPIRLEKGRLNSQEMIFSFPLSEKYLITLPAENTMRT